jgi:hypothetical protein
LANKGNQVGLLRGAGTRFASWFYAMMRLLHLKEPLKSTIYQQKFRDIFLNASARAAVKDIGDEKLWKCMCILLRSVYPALRDLCYRNSSKPSMDKIFFLSHRTMQTIEISKESLDDESLFGSLKMDPNLSREGNMVWGNDHDDNDEDDNVVLSLDPPNDVSDDPFDSDVDVGANFQLTFAGQIGWHWNHRKEKLEHEYAVTALALCVMEDVRQDVQQRLNDGHGKYQDAIERVVSRLDELPCANTHPVWCKPG